MASEFLIQQLEYLVALAREKHFGRAASACNVSQPTLSVAIKRLERDLDVGIVRRGSRFEGLTPEGSQVLAWAHRILAERDELLADLGRMRGRLTAMAKIGAIPTSIPASPLLTRKFLEQNPHATVRVQAMSSREIAAALASFELDAGLTYLDDETPPGCNRIELYRERYVLLAPADHPMMLEPRISWSKAATLRLCALTPAMRNRRTIDSNMAADGVSFEPVVEADTVGALYAHLCSLGLSTIASHTWLHAFGVPPGMDVRCMEDKGIHSTVGLVVLQRKPTSIVGNALVAAAQSLDFEENLEMTFSQWLTAQPGAEGRRRIAVDGRA